MTKRSFLTSIFLFISLVFISADDYLFLDYLDGITIEEERPAQAEINTASSVTVIHSDYIETLQPESTEDLLEKVIGASVKSQGSIGALQNIQIRGIAASKTSIFLDGVPLDSSQNNVFDLSLIPVDSIERIEIIKSGPGNLGKTQTLGGMVNIITKEGEDRNTPFTVSIEQGSYLPQPYGNEGIHSWESLFDSQKAVISYTIPGIFISTGLVRAANNYTYLDAVETRQLRDNADLLSAYGQLNLDFKPGKVSFLKSHNLFSFKSLGIPGSTTFGLTPNDYQKDIIFTTNNTYRRGEDSPFSAELNYRFTNTFFHDDDWNDSSHISHILTTSAQKTLSPSEVQTFTAGVQLHAEFLESSDLGNLRRINPRIFGYGSLYTSNGLISISPSVSVDYYSDMQTFSPSGSLGATLIIDEKSSLLASVSYAEQVPSFNELYWPGFSNPNLETERGIHNDFSYRYTSDTVQLESTIFVKNIFNEISSPPPSYTPENIARSLYTGTEQSVEIQLTPKLHAAVGYLLNKSFNLTGDVSLSEAPEVTSVRKHTAHGELTYKHGVINTYISARYLGPATYADGIYIIDTGVTVEINPSFKLYTGIDNLLNTSYELSSGYPMPGTRIRLKAVGRF